jgi:hypothetical protein
MNLNIYNMKKITFLLAGLAGLAFSINAQTIVNTGAGNKHTILEEFTGTSCSNCPAGHTTANNMVTSNPGLVHVIAYSPTNSSYTTPANGATDFRRSFADAFYTGSFCSPSSGSRFMPSAFINRQLGTNNDILQSRTIWTGMGNSVLTESSPMNVGIKSTYNSTAQTLTIDVEVYYTSTVTANNNINVMITEDNLTSVYQSGSSANASNPYVYKHSFRENVTTGQWGEAITGTTTAGSLVTKQYVFNLSGAIDPINVANAHVVAFIVNNDASNKEVYTGISAVADGGQASTGVFTGIEDVNNIIGLNIYPNPSKGDVTVNINGENSSSLEVINVLGEIVHTETLNNASTQKVTLGKDVFASKGVYFIKISNDKTSVTERVIIQ